MDFYPINEAQKVKLVSVTEPLLDTPVERAYIEKLQSELTAKGRTTMMVMHGNGKISLFANRILADTAKKISLPFGRYKSKSKKYKNIRHLCECAFAENKDLTFEQFKSLIKKEFPDSAIIKNGDVKPMPNRNTSKSKMHYDQYRHWLVIQWQFQYIEKPKWAK